MKVFLGVKPEIFEPEDLEKHKEIRKKIKYVIPLTFVSFWLASAVKFKTYFYEPNIFKIAGIVVAVYVPSFVYYSYWRYKETEFIRSIFHKYRFD